MSQEKINIKRNDYMESLNLQAQLNDMNLQVNKNYLRTGQLPAVSQMPDTRTTSEKLANIEFLKSEIAKSMSRIGTPSFAYAVAQGMMDSPLNVDNKLVEYFAQNVDSIMRELEKKYKYGIRGDKNDIETLILFIKQMMTDQGMTTQSIKSYINSNNGAFGAKSTIISDYDMDGIIKHVEDMIRRINVVRTSYAIDFLNGVLKTLKIVKSIIPSNIELKSMITLLNEEPMDNPHLYDEDADLNNKYDNKLREYFGNEDVVSKDKSIMAFEINILFKILKQLPKYSDVQYLIGKLDMYLKERNSLKNVEEICERIESLFSEVLESIKTTGLNIARVRKYFLTVTNNYSEYIQDRYKAEKQARREAANKVHVIVDNPRDNAVWVRNAEEEVDNEEVGVEASVEAEEDDNVSDNIKKFKGRVLDPNLTFDDDNDDIDIDNLDDRPKGVIEQSIMDLVADAEEEEPQTGKGIRGRGISRPPTFSGFGINEINRKKLENGVLSVRRKTKTNYMDLPSRAISSNLKNIVKTISGGGIPNFNDLNKLTEDEQDYLYKLVKKSDLQDKLTVPTPSKDKQEQDFHQFEVLKGQIMSGNDSKELVKKFKLLVVKLSRQGVLPKSESSDLLLTLTELGY